MIQDLPSDEFVQYSCRECLKGIDLGIPLGKAVFEGLGEVDFSIFN